ncbi:trypsin-like peptidase domain-containing protein [Streptomyces reticuliscabiei]|uniref:trypsin-like peptidase domain-containing protein n=1 Tax=Streptomyces reticuliscabiei TaxID=146821 RepID=UPI000A3CF5D4|nr:trypsin-like peptidase domain-containing protein [Streptomyces reticuliscabiei]
MTTDASPRPVDDGLSSGSRRVLEVPALASLYVQPLSPMATVERGRAATAFVVRNRAGEPFLITNRHVVTGRNSKDNDRPSGAEISALRVLVQMAGPTLRWTALVLELGDEDGRPLWLEHPDHGKDVDVVAYPLLAESEENLDLIAYSAAGPACARVDLTTEMFVIGYPIGFDPFRASASIGVWTRGTVAWPPGIDWEDLPSTLIDCRARPGQSGSPVVFYADAHTTYLAADGVRRTGPVWDLVGVYSGRIAEGSDVGIVWKRSAIDAIVERGHRPLKPLVSPFDESVDRQLLTDPASKVPDRAGP